MTLDKLLSVPNKGVPATTSLFNSSALLSSASDEAKFFAENVTKNSNLDDAVISLSTFPSITNLNVHIIHVNPKLIKRVHN